ncbi:MAG: xanthine dehydrogenase family protein molybdopterin-binding subunit [Nostocoides sp.]
MTIAPERPSTVPLSPTAPTSAPARPSTTPGRPLGAPLDRIDGLAKVTGTAPFAGDHDVPDVTYAVLVHAPISRGRITRIDTTAATAQPGVVAVLTHLNAPVLTPPPTRLNPMDLSTMGVGSSIPFLNTEEIHVDGQPVAVVVAETIEAAERAAGLVEAAYETSLLTADFQGSQALAKPVRGLPAGPELSGKRGDARAAFAAAPVQVDLIFTTPQQNHNAIEPHTTTAWWEGNRLTVHEGTQNLDWSQKVLARAFAIPAGDVHVVSPFVGGAFGGKSKVWAGTIIACMAARVVRRPVRLALSREGVYRTVGGRTPTRQRVALGSTADGHLTALIHSSVSRRGRVGGGPEQIVACSLDLYGADTILAEQSIVELDLMSNTAMRAPGETQGTYAVESAIDELAVTLDLDPVDLRLRNQPGEHRPISRASYSHRRLAETLERGREVFGWADRPPSGSRDGKDLVGWGVAAAIHPAWEFPANVRLTADVTGQVRLDCAFHEMGMGSATAISQVVADLLRIDPVDVVIGYGASHLPTGPGAGGSGQTASVAGSVERACTALRRKIDAMAVKTGTSAGSPIADVLAAAGQPSLTVQIGADNGPRAMLGQARFIGKLIIDSRRWMKAATGAHYCEIRIDADTGELRVSRWLGVFDIGRVVNPKLAGSQLRGGIVMGIGMALGEETIIDPRTGRIMNPSLAEYHVPVHADIPRIDILTLDDPDPTMPLGIVGAGEVGITGVSAAVANAVRHATGRRLTDLPMTLDKILG